MVGYEESGNGFIICSCTSVLGRHLQCPGGISRVVCAGGGGSAAAAEIPIRAGGAGFAQLLGGSNGPGHGELFHEQAWLCYGEHGEAMGDGARRPVRRRRLWTRVPPEQHSSDLCSFPRILLLRQ